MAYLNAAAQFEDAAARGALATRLLADVGVIDPVDIRRAEILRRRRGADHRLGVTATPQL